VQKLAERERSARKDWLDFLRKITLSAVCVVYAAANLFQGAVYNAMLCGSAFA